MYAPVLISAICCRLLNECSWSAELICPGLLKLPQDKQWWSSFQCLASPRLGRSPGLREPKENEIHAGEDVFQSHTATLLCSDLLTLVMAVF